MDESMEDAIRLSPTEARIVGCLIEKASTTPEAYPLTVNSLVLAANQKTSRDPLMQLEEGEVGHALRELEDRGWVRVVHGSRALRYEHRIDELLSTTKPQRALLCLLMLRGPQTMSELLTRSDRLAEIRSLEEVKAVLERLQQRGFVACIGRESGQREDRHAQLFCGPVQVSTPSRRDDGDAPSGATASTTSPLAQRVSELEATVTELRARIDALEAAVLASSLPAS